MTSNEVVSRAQGEVGASSSPSGTLGIIAGNGTFPLLVAEEAHRRGLTVIAVAHLGDTDPKIESVVDRCIWIKVGQLGKMVRAFQSNGVHQAVMAGGISRAGFFKRFSPDWMAIRLLAGLRRITDDSLLRRVAEKLEEKGIHLTSAMDLLQQAALPSGYFTARKLSSSELADAILGWEVAESLGKADVGQTVIISHLQVVAVEGLEGTDAAIQRAGSLLAGVSKTMGVVRLLKGEIASSGFVVVKRSKPGQDLRMDQPTIGLRTLEVIKQAGGSGLVVEAERTLVIESDKVLQYANSNGISLLAVKDAKELAAYSATN